MSNISKVLEYIKNNPGVLPSEVAAALPHINKSTAFGAVENLWQTGKIQRVESADGFRYMFAQQELNSNSVLAALEKRAVELEKKRQWRRAATLWLQAYDAATLNADREKYRKRRARCLTGMTRGKPDGGQVAGHYVGGN
jgi:DNA-binding MarR family transcriptional regulator